MQFEYSDQIDYSSQKCLEKPIGRHQSIHQRFQAHSLVGTPNYIAPEVLRNTSKLFNGFKFTTWLKIFIGNLAITVDDIVVHFNLIYCRLHFVL